VFYQRLISDLRAGYQSRYCLFGYCWLRWGCGRERPTTLLADVVSRIKEEEKRSTADSTESDVGKITGDDEHV
jgi:hypothetical protein